MAILKKMRRAESRWKRARQLTNWAGVFGSKRNGSPRRTKNELANRETVFLIRLSLSDTEPCLCRGEVDLRSVAVFPSIRKLAYGPPPICVLLSPKWFLADQDNELCSVRK